MPKNVTGGGGGGGCSPPRPHGPYAYDFKHRKNAPMARQTFLAAKPLAGETINNFRDRAISFIKDRNLKAKLHREETLTMSKLMEIVSQYHDKEALILTPEGQENNISVSPRQVGKCWRCDKVGHYAKECRRSRDHKCGKCGKIGHFELCCKTKQNKECTTNRSTSQFRGNTRGKPKIVRRGGKPQGQHVALPVTEETMDGNHFQTVMISMCSPQVTLRHRTLRRC